MILGSTAPGTDPVLVAGKYGWVYVTDIIPQSSGVVTDKVYQDSGSTVLQSALSSTEDVRVYILASYPLVNVDGTDATLTRHGDQSHYGGYVDISVANSKDISIYVTTTDNNVGATDTVYLEIDSPADILTLSFSGSYPGSQTELKAGDSFQIVGTTSADVDAVEILDYGACINEVKFFAAGTVFSVSGTIANRGTTAQLLPARVRARSASTGDYGSCRDTNELGGNIDGLDVVNCNNLYPTVIFGTKTYPPSQSALKNSETATVAVTTANFDTIAYASPNGELAITNPTTDEPVKTVGRISGTYNDSVANLRGQATRNANGATTTTDTIVDIAHVAVTLSVVEQETRLRSGAFPGATYTITINLDQTVTTAPLLDEDTPNAGEFQGTWDGSGMVWTRSLKIVDTDVPNTYTWQNPHVVNRAGIITSSITGDANYIIGGFTKRTVTFAAWSQTAELPVAVTNYSKLQAGIFTATNQQSIRNPIQGNQDDIANNFTVLNIGSAPVTIFWNDLAAANTNSTGTAQLIDIEEVV